MIQYGSLASYISQSQETRTIFTVDEMEKILMEKGKIELREDGINLNSVLFKRDLVDTSQGLRLTREGKIKLVKDREAVKRTNFWRKKRGVLEKERKWENKQEKILLNLPEKPVLYCTTTPVLYLNVR